MGQLIQYSQ